MFTLYYNKFLCSNISHLSLLANFLKKLLDCSEINSKSITGLYDKLRCKAGKPPREKKSIGEKFKGWFKPKN